MFATSFVPFGISALSSPASQSPLLHFSIRPRIIRVAPTSDAYCSKKFVSRFATGRFLDGATAVLVAPSAGA
jgi:hypothetical protein